MQENLDLVAASETGTPEPDNAEDYEFDESQDLGNSIDGMGFLTSEAGKAGYTGPQSGIAALKILRSLPSGYHIEDVGAVSLDPTMSDYTAVAGNSSSSIESHISEYFTYYHPAYPLLHEGLFRARVSGKLL